ncbi:elongation factor P 5-aminopentanone reductase [Allobacillus halotolerans]|uniref:SDR family oxidoreductase n=1 Tax=Allobacillus halotolerans TaxID=570278 RepID=A0ABS6GR18_9BACI|nr:SDR family oxidoreductase [Allobacillus halotolerans]MBU6081099.1 SDR family oxidoreductase [Allobacillus halotolerans]
MRETVLVIGASSDLAQEAIHSLAHPSRQFILHYHENNEAIEKTMSLLDEDQVIMSVQANLTDETEIHQLIESIPFQIYGILFAQGRSYHELLTESSAEKMDEQYKIHVKSTMLIAKAFIPQMIARKEGNIVVISSIWGELGASNESVYAAMKGAQIAWMKSIAKEVGPSKIRVNAVTPGLIDTKMNKLIPVEDQEEWTNQVPLQRAGQPKDVANLIRFLFSSESKYVHGQVLRLSGGL